ncbi:MAG: response regulator transcription factor [Chloroflexi bacterium]|nr:response regulator transcription factor [Chloroflexota bacterium]
MFYWTQLPIQITTALTLALTLWLAHLTWRMRPAPGANTLTWLLLSVSLWSGGYLVFFSVSDASLRLLAVKCAYLGIVSAPLLSLNFVLHYTGFGAGSARSRWQQLLLWVIPGLTFFLAASYPWSRAVWSDFTIAPDGTYSVHYGPWFGVAIAYFWAISLAAPMLMSWHAFMVRKAYRRMALLVAAAVFLPLIPNVLWILRLLPGVRTDFSYLGVLAGATLLLVAVKRGKFLKVRPIPLDRLMDQMSDAMLLINVDQRVVDCNRAALADLGLSELPFGQPLFDLLTQVQSAGPLADPDTPWSLTLLAAALQAPEGGDGDLVVVQPALRHLHWRVSSLGDAGWLLVWRDVTRDRLKLAMLYEQEQALRSLVERFHQENESATQQHAALEQLCAVGQDALEALEHGSTAVGAATLARLLALARHAVAISGQNAATRSNHDLPTAEPAFYEAVDAFLQAHGRAHGYPVTFACADRDLLSLISPWMLVQWVRILQETLEGLCPRLACQALQVRLTTEESSALLTVTIDHPTESDRSVAALLQTWLENSSLPRRLAAISGQLDTALQPASTQLTVRLPKVLAQQIASLKDQRVLLGGASPPQTAAVADLLRAQRLRVVGVAHTADTLVAHAQSTQPQIILVDIALLEPAQTALLHQLRRTAANARLVVLLHNAAAEQSPGSAVLDGADGYLHTDLPPERFAAALANLLDSNLPLLSEVADDLLSTALATPPPPAPPKPGLTDRQQNILALITRGLTYREISAQLYLSERTIRYDVQEIRRRMGVSSRSEMVAFALTHQLQTPLSHRASQNKERSSH